MHAIRTMLVVVWSAGRCVGALPILLIAAVAAFATPGAGEWLQYDRGAIVAGQVWRVLTGHLAHWTADHLFWDAGALALLGGLLARRTAAGFGACVLASALAISGAVWVWAPDVPTYRGLSGVDSALFAALAVVVGTEAARRRDVAAAVLVALFGGLFIAKTAYEATSGSTVFVDSAGLRPLALAHVVGAAAGALVGVAIVAAILPHKWGFLVAAGLRTSGRKPSAAT